MDHLAAAHSDGGDGTTRLACSTTECTSGDLPRIVFRAVKVAKTCDATLYETSETETFGEDGEPAIEGGGEKYEASPNELGVFVETCV